MSGCCLGTGGDDARWKFNTSKQFEKHTRTDGRTCVYVEIRNVRRNERRLADKVKNPKPKYCRVRTSRRKFIRKLVISVEKKGLSTRS